MTREASSEAMRRIGLSLKSWRAMGGVTADELAEAIGVSRDTLSRVERGDSSVGVGTVLYAVAMGPIVGLVLPHVLIPVREPTTDADAPNGRPAAPGDAAAAADERGRPDEDDEPGDGR